PTDRHQLHSTGVEGCLWQQEASRRFLRKPLTGRHALRIDLGGKSLGDIGLQGTGDRRQALTLGNRCQVLKANPLASSLHASLVVTLAAPSKARLKQIVADQRPESLRQL